MNELIIQDGVKKKNKRGNKKKTTTKTTKIKSMKRAATKGNTSTSKQSQGVSSYWQSIKTHMSRTDCSLSEARGWYKSQNE